MGIFDIIKKSRLYINKENHSQGRAETRKKNSDGFADIFGLGISSSSRRDTFSEFGDIWF